MKKPEVEIVKQIDYLKVRDYLVKIGEITDKQAQEFWRTLCDCGYVKNGTAFYCDFKEWVADAEYDGEEAHPMAVAITKHFPDIDTWQVSW